jgi:hypothetical protein
VNAYTAEGNQARRPSRAPLNDAERAAIRIAGAQAARRSRIAQGLPEWVEDPVGVAILARLLRTARSTRCKTSASDEGKPAA